MIEVLQGDIELIAEAEKIDSATVAEEILKTAQISWENQLSPKDLQDWLNNFSGDALGSIKAEQNLALWLLSSFVYFTIDDVRGFCQQLFAEFVHAKLIEYQEKRLYQELSIAERVAHILNSTVFLTLGNDSESGSNILYYFRQINHLQKYVFEKDLSKSYENLVFVDDVTISGIQALTYIPQIKESIVSDKQYYLTFLASDTAIDMLQPLDIKIICCNRLTEREKCFSEDSFVFNSGSRKRFLSIAARMCNYYGERITQNHPEANGYPLGFDGAQSLFCFFYNTPDNTLPIFWCDGNGWKPIFKRYEKLTNKCEVRINDVKYV